MANPLFNSIFGGGGNDMSMNPSVLPEAGKTAGNAPQMTMQDAMSELRANPAEMIRKGGYKVPDEIVNDPQATVMHLIRSGQVGNPMMRMIAPMLNRMGVR